MDGAKRSQEFKHLIYRSNPDPELRLEILATDGRAVRRLAALPHRLVFQEFEDTHTAAALVRAIEDALTHNLAVGYSLLKDEPVVAFVHTGDHLNPGWMTARLDDEILRLPKLRLLISDTPQLRLVGGATTNGRVLRALLEQRGSEFAESPLAFDITKHLVQWRLNTTVAEVVVQREPTRPALRTDRRIQQDFVVEDIDTKATLEYMVEFDRELFCLPRDWLIVPLKAEVTHDATD